MMCTFSIELYWEAIWPLKLHDTTHQQDNIFDSFCLIRSFDLHVKRLNMRPHNILSANLARRWSIKLRMDNLPIVWELRSSKTMMYCNYQLQLQCKIVFALLYLVRKFLFSSCSTNVPFKNNLLTCSLLVFVVATIKVKSNERRAAAATLFVRKQQFLPSEKLCRSMHCNSELAHWGTWKPKRHNKNR